MHINEFGIRLYAACDVAKRMGVHRTIFNKILAAGLGPKQYAYKNATGVYFTEKEVMDWIVHWRLHRNTLFATMK